jgi:hypothetical protein
MSKTNVNTKKIVRISEHKLIDLIDEILNEAIAVKKQEWITEQKKMLQKIQF